MKVPNLDHYKGLYIDAISDKHERGARGGIVYYYISDMKVKNHLTLYEDWVYYITQKFMKELVEPFL